MTYFEQLPDHSRIWIYQAPRPLTMEEEEVASAVLEKFISEWKAHGTDLDASYTIREHRFIIIGVDESSQPATGCSIDASVGMIRTLQNELGIDLLDRTQVAFVDNGMVVSVPMMDFSKMVREGDISPETTVFNNMVTTMGEFRDHWRVPAVESWHKRFFSTVK